MASQSHRDDETWATIIAAWEASGLTTDAFALRGESLANVLWKERGGSVLESGRGSIHESVKAR